MAADGRFIMIQAGPSEAPQTQIAVVQNWFDDVKSRFDLVGHPEAMKLQTVVWLAIWVPVLVVVFYRRWMKRDGR